MGKVGNYSARTVGVEWVTVMDVLNLNNTISLYTKNNSEWKRSVSLGYFMLYLYCCL